MNPPSMPAPRPSRPRSSCRYPPAPAFHPDHPWVSGNQAATAAPAATASGNENGQRGGATSVRAPSPMPQHQAPQVPQLPQLPPLIPVNQPSHQPGQIRPRSFSEAASGEAAARQTVRDSLSHQASAGAQIRALRTREWSSTLEDAFGVSLAVHPEMRSPGQSRDLGARPRTQSLGTAPRGSGI